MIDDKEELKRLREETLVLIANSPWYKDDDVMTKTFSQIPEKEPVESLKRD